MLHEMKIILIPDEKVLLQFSLSVLKASIIISLPLSFSVTCWKAFWCEL